MVTKKGVILFDTPWQKKYFQPLLDSIRVRHHKKVMMVISTHWHQDRTAGLKYYASKGIKTYTSRQTDSLCVLHHKNRARFLIPRDTTFHIGEGSFQTYYPGPGHTMDNIVIWFPKQKLLYGGCFIKSTDVKTLGNIEDGNVKDWEQSLRRLQKKFPDPKYIITGHYSWRDKKSISHTLDMVEAYNKNHS
jgi:metallo-beta-lactamase class B